MASSENKLLIQMIHKLGLSQHDQLLPKSTELFRLLQLKCTGGATNLGDYAKATICINLATTLLSLPFDNEIALKLCAMNKSTYANAKRTSEKILDISKTIGISEICIQLGLNQAQKEASILLENYKRYVGGAGSSEIDFAHPQYAAMAVYQACKKLKVKPPKTKLVAFSHLKPTQWSMLEKNWENFLSSFADVDASEKSKVSKANETEPRLIEETAVDTRTIGLKHSSPEKIEPYVNWKKRMLEKAYRELKTR
ncbi:origin recognition complex subunit 6 [Ochlerotatus camptorhynchus]|uniref:origin recognition complex subunit 6 n=1 Tax=Ochlerotatus camptorhynchus TaxID=644619 RepID=UPI0031DC3B34